MNTIMKDPSREPLPYWTPAATLARRGAPPCDALYNMRQMTEHHGIIANPTGAFYTAYFVIERAFVRQAQAMYDRGEPVPWVMDVEVDGHTLHCGYGNYKGRNSFGVSAEDADAVLDLRERHKDNGRPLAERVYQNNGDTLKR